jgi:DNA-directed RNA polymerase II subunit RPB11
VAWRAHSGRTRRVAYQRDTKLGNTATVEIQREDHTIGEPIVTHLHDDSNVVFAGMKIPHPLEYRMLIRIRTNGSVSPQDAYNKACEKLQSQLANMKDQFKLQVEELAHSDHGLQVDWEPDSAYEQTQLAYGDQDAYGVGAPYDADMAGQIVDPSLAFS